MDKTKIVIIGAGSVVFTQGLVADMILAALNSAYAEVDNQVKDSLSGMLGGIDMSQIANLFRQ